jgi:DNA modification methylase
MRDVRLGAPDVFLDGKVTQWCGDVRQVLKHLPADYFDCVVTSPPYWGLRDYGVEGQLGLERSLGEHLAVMVDVFAEVRRVLKPSGTLWVNYGDCYAASPNGRSAADTKAAGNDDRTFRDKPFSTVGAIYDPNGGAKGGGYRGKNKGNSDSSATPKGRVVGGKLVKWNRRSERGGHNLGGSDEAVADYRVMHAGYLKPKDLCMVPNRLAIALQDDGWWVRSEIIWHKPNPMPESIKDRPGTSHEKIWLLTKQANYFYDAEAIAEPVTGSTIDRVSQATWADQVGSERANGGAKTNGNMKAVVHRAKDHANGAIPPNSRPHNLSAYEAKHNREYPTRNSRNVWTIGTEPFSEAHFAVFPSALAERCIKAGSPAGGLVLDPFGGAGTTALAAATLGRSCTLIELNSEYCRLARARIEAAFMGKDEGARHMVRQLEKLADPGPLFGGSE